MYFKKADIPLYALIIIAAYIFLATLPVCETAKYERGTAAVEKGGAVTLFELGHDGVYDIKTHILEIKDGRARVTHASCPLKICEKQGWVSDGVIVCVPNRTVIVITPLHPKHDDMDVIVQ